MRFSHSPQTPEELQVDTYALAIDQLEALDAPSAELSPALRSTLQRLRDDQEIDTQKPEVITLHCTDAPLKRLLIITTGACDSSYSLGKFASTLAAALVDSKAQSVALSLPSALLAHSPLLAICRAIAAKAYRFDGYRSQTSTPERMSSVTLTGPSAPPDQSLARINALNDGIDYCKFLGNTPPNICTPTFLAEQAVKLAQTFDSIETEVLEQPALEALKMGCLLAVSKGSEQAPKFIVMQYRGAGDAPPIALVGKGVTFDTGGISIKPSAGMEQMTYDMLGAASVFGALRAAAVAELPLNLVAVVPAVENMPDGRAARPGDIVTSMNGQSVEILNTDAEGRLILCDALCYTQRNFKPSVMIDMATLTGAAIVALGHKHSALYSNNSTLAAALESAGLIAHDTAWRLPLDPEYNDLLKSRIADMGNIGGKSAGSITAACFLQRFVDADQPWAHLDIAGTAMGGNSDMASGRPVSLVFQYLCDALQ